MPRKKHSEVVAGAFVLATLATLLGIVLWLGGSQFMTPKGQLVAFYLNQQQGGAGLAEGAAVTYGDTNIGRVASIATQLDKGRCVYWIQLERKDILIHADGKARVSSSSALGASRIVIISNGTPDAPLADEQHAIPLSGGMEQAISDLADTVKQAKEIVAAIQREVDPKGGNLLGLVHELVASLNKAGLKVVAIADGLMKLVDVKEPDSPAGKLNKSLADLNDITGDAKPKVKQTLDSLASLSQRLDEYGRKDVGDLLAKLRETNTEIYKAAKNLGDASQQVKELLAGNRDSLDTTVDNMAKVSANLKGMSEEVRRAPWMLLYKPTEKELKQQSLFGAARAFAEGAAQMDQSIARLKGLIQGGQVKGDDPAIQQLIKDLQGQFKQYTKIEQELWDVLQKESRQP